MTTPSPNIDEVQAAAQAVCAELGNWTISEIGEDGLVDEIPDIYPPCAQMASRERTAFVAAVIREIYK